MTIKTSIMAVAAAIALAMPAGALTAQEASQCSTMASSFQVRQTEVVDLQTRQAELAAEAERLGEDWELKEEIRNFSAENAAAADEARIAYETARADAMLVTSDLRSKAQMLNADIAHFNTRCTGN